MNPDPSAPACAEPVRVIDGDGFSLHGQSVRLWGIDAPELDQTCDRAGETYPCGLQARDALKTALRGAVPRCESVNRDQHGRTIARCSVAGDDLAGSLVRQGWALDWPRYSGGAYAADQDAAKSARRGMWSGEFVQPWQWRQDH